jgi:hypothetical protein
MPRRSPAASARSRRRGRDAVANRVGSIESRSAIGACQGRDPPSRARTAGAQGPRRRRGSARAWAACGAEAFAVAARRRRRCHAATPDMSAARARSAGRQGLRRRSRDRRDGTIGRASAQHERDARRDQRHVESGDREQMRHTGDGDARRARPGSPRSPSTMPTGRALGRRHEELHRPTSPARDLERDERRENSGTARRSGGDAPAATAAAGERAASRHAAAGRAANRPRSAAVPYAGAPRVTRCHDDRRERAGRAASRHRFHLSVSSSRISARRER